MTLPPSSNDGPISPPPATSPTPSAAPPFPFSPSALPARRSESELPADPIADTPPSFDLPEVLGPGGALAAFAICVRERAVGALCIEVAEGVRRILLRDGDVVTAASGLDAESLVAFLGTRGDIGQDVVRQLHGKIPAFGRHAGAALVANGHISQDQLWPVLRAHAEWILRCAIGAEKGTASFEVNPPGRLKAEPSVFGGATGAEVLIEVVRRAIPAQSALLQLGGGEVRLIDGPRRELLSECALPDSELRWLNRAKGATLDEVLASGEHLDLGPMVYALVKLGVLAVATPQGRSRSQRAGRAAKFDPIDIETLRNQVKTRLSLVEEGDYFSLLGVPRNATGYDIHRAYVELRRGLEPSRVLNAATADLADDLQLIINVLDEAHDILRDQGRRERYRRAIEEKPPL